MINRMVKWNISSRRSWFQKADVLIVSVPKSGRTWLRVFIQAYLDAITGEGDPFKTENLPRISFAHDLWEHLTARHLWDRIRGKYLIPQKIRPKNGLFSCTGTRGMSLHRCIFN